jgi:transcription elongation factor GreA
MVKKDDQILLTREGLKELKQELNLLSEKKRPDLVARLAKARSEGDLSENSNYIQSREELSFLDGRIEELEDVISKAVLVTKDKDCDQVELGCEVTVKIGKKKSQRIFRLVGEWEADPVAKKISYQSPLGQALMGKKVGEEVEVEAPVGKLVYQIVKID